MDQKKITIAIHETGHAVMALICGHDVKKVSLKGMMSPRGTDTFLGFMTLESNDSATRFTGKKAIDRVRIALSGYASEILFSGVVSSFGGQDLVVATEMTEGLLQDAEFKSWVATLPSPALAGMEIIENPMVRAYIELKIEECVRTLIPLKPAIQEISRELLLKEELSGAEVAIILDTTIGKLRSLTQTPQF